jgi:Na+/H+ antiporter NhaC
MAETGWTEYFTNIGHALLNRKEHFNDSSDSAVAKQSFAIIILIILIYVIIMFLAIYGAARLSYCYNIYYGADSSTALGFAILSGIFSSIYYPFYGIFLNPLCNLQKTGGRR